MSARSTGTFGEGLKRLREEAGLTQEELASRAGLTAKGIGALERGERRRPYPHTLRALADALHLTEEAREALVGSVPGRAAAAKPSAVTLPLPSAPSTPLIGREREAEEVGKLLSRNGDRLLTLTGPGGIGKTRLALEVARDAAGNFADGVAFVALAPLCDADLVAPAISQVLGLQEASSVSPLDAVCAHLRSKRALLVLDNFEHLLEAAPEVAVLIESCKDLTVLSTSRAPLRVRGEQEYPVSPLTLPSSTRNPGAEEVLNSASGRLFVERARAASPRFGLTGENAGAVAAICWRLDGLPLALELAAAKARFLDPTTLLSRLDQALSAGWARDLPERQRTMRATLDWSHGLLSGPQQGLFRRLSVFTGGFSLDAAESVGPTGRAGEEDVLELLGGLAEQSLVTVDRDPNREARYAMLEPIRQYALEKLEEGGGAGEARERHAAFFLSLAEQARPHLRAARQVEWLERLERENGNLRSAMTWALSTGRIEEAARMGWSLWAFWWIHNYQREGRRWMEWVLARSGELSLPRRARAVMAAEAMAYGQGDGETVERHARELMELSRRAGGDAHAEAYARAGFGLVATVRGDYEAAVEHLEKGLPLFLASGEEDGMAAQTHTWVGTVLLLQGADAQAKQRFEEGLALGRRIGDRLAVCNALFNLSQLALLRGDYDLAASRFAEGIPPSQEMGDLGNVAYIMEGLAVVAGGRGEPGRSARLFAAAEGLIEQIGLRGHTYYRTDASLYENTIAEVRSSLGGPAFEEAQEEGRTMTTAQAIEYALEE